MKSWWQAVKLGAYLWALIFFEVSLLMFGAKLSPPSPIYYTIHFIVISFFITLCALYYFKQTKSRGLSESLQLSIVMIITGIILDSIITIPLFVHDYSFFVRPDMLTGYILAIGIISILGAQKKSK